MEIKKDKMYAVLTLVDYNDYVPESDVNLFFTKDGAEHFLNDFMKEQAKNYQEGYGIEPKTERSDDYAAVVCSKDIGGTEEWYGQAVAEIRVFDLSGRIPIRIPMPTEKRDVSDGTADN